MASRDRHNPTHNIRTYLTILRKNKHTNQQKETETNSINNRNTILDNCGNPNIRNNNINLASATVINLDFQQISTGENFVQKTFQIISDKPAHNTNCKGKKTRNS